MNARCLDTTQRAETISMLETAAQNGVRESDLVAVAERYIWNAYARRCNIVELAGMCFDAELSAGTLARPYRL